MQTQEVEDVGEKQGSDEQIIPKTGTKSSEEAISNQSEMMEEILSRLPVKTVLQFSCVSKPWCNLISNPSFVKLHSNRTNHHGIIISAYNQSTYEKYFLFASHNGGSISQILTVPGFEDCKQYNITKSQHVNGLLLFHPVNWLAEDNLAIVYNPCTHKIFKIPPGDDLSEVSYYSLGFNESRSEHMILNIKKTGLEIEIFSLSTYSWRKIDVDFPIDPWMKNWYSFNHKSFCVNSVIYFMPYEYERRSILSFDLISETFSAMNSPTDRDFLIFPFRGFLGLSNLLFNWDSNKMEVWVLEDHKNQVWVKDTITLPDCWISRDNIPFPIDKGISSFCNPHPVDGIGSCGIVFAPRRVSMDVLSIPIYDKKKGSFTSVEVNLTHELLCSETLQVDPSCVSSYVESMIPLKNSTELVSFISGKRNDQKGTTNS